MSVTFTTTTPRGSLAIIIVLLLWSLFMGISEGLIFYFQIILLSLVFLALFIRYKFVIEESRLTYQVLLVNVPIFIRELQPNDIQNVKFKRVGWAKKAGIIKPKKGINLRIINFSPDDVFDKLKDFVTVYDISSSKTKDYQILDK